jgi:hypothetical protein
VRHPASWRLQRAEQEGVSYRHFLAPPVGATAKPSVSATLLAARHHGSVDEYAHAYLAGNTLASSRAEERRGLKGKSYLFTSPDGVTRYALMLFQDQDQVYGLYAQGETPLFQRDYSVLEEMARSLTFERPATYPVRKIEGFDFTLRVPPSWRESRRFSGNDTLLLQFTSPPLAADEDGQTVHAALTLTAEPLPEGGTLDSFYEATRQKLGESYLILSHEPWPPGYADVMRTETPVAVSSVKRFYRVAGKRGYSLAFECRGDVFHRASRWYDVIASTFETGAEASSTPMSTAPR